MNRKKLLYTVSIGVVCIAALMLGVNATASGTPPDCNCLIFNWPEPGEMLPGVVVDRDENVCYAMECNLEIEDE